MTTDYYTTIHDIPPTTNHMYITTKTGRRFPNPKFKQLKERIIAQMPKITIPPAWYLLKIQIHTKIYTKTGKNPGRVRKFDISNRIKFIEDILSEVTELDDMFFQKVEIEKFDADEDMTTVELVKLSELPDV